jgi:hypothetical protein
LSPWKWVLWSACYLLANIQLLAHGIVLKTWTCVPYAVAGLVVWAVFSERQRSVERSSLRFSLAPVGLYLLWTASVYSTMKDQLWGSIFGLVDSSGMLESGVRFVIRAACVVLGLGFLYFVLIPRCGHDLGGGLGGGKRRELGWRKKPILEMSSDSERARQVFLFYWCAVYLSLLQNMEQEMTIQARQLRLLTGVGVWRDAILALLGTPSEPCLSRFAG